MKLTIKQAGGCCTHFLTIEVPSPMHHASQSIDWCIFLQFYVFWQAFTGTLYHWMQNGVQTVTSLPFLIMFSWQLIMYVLALGFIFSLIPIRINSSASRRHIIDGCLTHCNTQHRNVNNLIKVRMADWYFDDYIWDKAIQMILSALNFFLLFLSTMILRACGNSYKNPKNSTSFVSFGHCSCVDGKQKWNCLRAYFCTRNTWQIILL